LNNATAAPDKLLTHTTDCTDKKTHNTITHTNDLQPSQPHWWQSSPDTTTTSNNNYNHNNNNNPSSATSLVAELS
jgi:hypothetical protein